MRVRSKFRKRNRVERDHFLKNFRCQRKWLTLAFSSKTTKEKAYGSGVELINNKNAIAPEKQTQKCLLGFTSFLILNSGLFLADEDA